MTTNSKEWIQYMTATVMVVSGVVLSFISFFTKGNVTDGLLWYMATVNLCAVVCKRASAKAVSIVL